MTVSDLIKKLGNLDNHTEDFLLHFLGAQCFLGPAEAGAILRTNNKAGVDVIAIYPQLEKGASAPAWLGQVEKLTSELNDDGVAIVPLERIEQVYDEALKRLEKEKSWMQKIKQGQSSLDAVGLREQLEEMDMEYRDE